MKELPFETYQRVMGCSWPGGRSRIICLLLKLFWILDSPGTASANLALQERLNMVNFDRL